jgi:hypothetical protein
MPRLEPWLRTDDTTVIPGGRWAGLGALLRRISTAEPARVLRPTRRRFDPRFSPTLLVLRFLHGGTAANPSIKLGLSKNQTVLESAELGDLLPGGGIFLQSFVLRRFSIV